jgi:GNAT superfamily N-acetyltransferase
MVSAMAVRARTDADLDACVEMAVLVHQRDGYPVYLPTDLRAFLASPDAFGAWVVEEADGVVGHVALHRRTSAAALAVAAAALRQPVERLGVVARLLVAPTARRRGVGRELLEMASRHAVARGLWPMLDVATHYRGAVRLYEECGWTRAGDITLRFTDEVTLDEHIYVGPLRPDGD